MSSGIQGKVAVITGGTRGIGLAVAAELLDLGAMGVAITSRRPENLEEAIAQLKADGADPARVLSTVARADDDLHAARAIRETIERFGSCDILVNNAATNPAAGNLMEVSRDAVDKTWAVNQRAPLIWTQEAWAQWMGSHGGCVVNVASVGGVRPAPMLGIYNTSKAALIYMTGQLAMELAPRVRVNAVAPAVIKTRLSAMLWESDPQGAARMHPLQRLGEPGDVARAVAFLCSENASWITGVTLPVDGGVLGATSGMG
ncbi:MAG: SDR family oxidoreductase [Acidimicrobiia bacterium]|nr:SDR family oxidoreductase [Acidimicrobiia bacterium]MYJ15848.1 SDR family oxidoreductase [Acidimicrobiia bacterium]